jgi:hypothetical protein
MVRYRPAAAGVGGEWSEESSEGSEGSWWGPDEGSADEGSVGEGSVGLAVRWRLLSPMARTAKPTASATSTTPTTNELLSEAGGGVRTRQVKPPGSEAVLVKATSVFQ